MPDDDRSDFWVEPVSLLFATFLLRPKDALRQKSAHPFFVRRRGNSTSLICLVIYRFIKYLYQQPSL